MEFTTPLYRAYKGIVYAQAIELSNKYGIDQEMLLSEGMVLFTHAVNTFDCDRKIAFSTHLTWTLKNLEKVAKKEMKVESNYFNGIPYNPELMGHTEARTGILQYNEGFFEQAIASIDFSQEKYDLVQDIALQLSQDSQTYLHDLFKGVHQQDRNPKGGRPEKFPVEKVAAHYNWSIKQAQHVKSEIKEWWTEYRKVS